MRNDEKFDYYNNSFSFMKYIMNNINSSKKNLESLVVSDIFNNIVNDMDSQKIYEMIIYSSLFEKKVNEINIKDKKNIINNLYELYIQPMILNYVNNEMEMTEFFFNSLKNKVVSLSGFYGIFGDNMEMFHENIKKTR